MGKKSKGPRGILGLRCTVCHAQNYLTQRNRTNTPEKLELLKYCSKCRKHTPHKEQSKLK
ncbi:MAG: 50S ribosomal protein L33 [Candidatus Beckwithbacteria bacterium]